MIGDVVVVLLIDGCVRLLFGLLVNLRVFIGVIFWIGFFVFGLLCFRFVFCFFFGCFFGEFGVESEFVDVFVLLSLDLFDCDRIGEIFCCFFGGFIFFNKVGFMGVV